MSSFLPAAPFLTGFGTGTGLIIAIGAQNAFVLTQGIKRQHVLTVATLCTLIDAGLIAAGVLGMGALISQSPLFLQAALWLGAVFLLIYGYRALRAALNPDGLKASNGGTLSRKQAVLTTLALSLLNPHVYLDTVVLLGSIGGQYAEAGRWAFIVGATCGSLLWFFGLAFGARQLAPAFARPAAWRVLDGVICVVMWGIAASLIAKAVAAW